MSRAEAARIVFMGSDAIAVPALKYLKESPDYKLLAVVSQPDRPVGRGKKTQPNPLAKAAEELGVELIKPEKPDSSLLNWILDHSIDLAVVMAYGHILKDELINAPRLGMVNLHASLLPAYRGASPIVGSIASGDKETGISLMRIVRKMDAGAVMDTEKVSINDNDTRQSVTQKLADASPALLKRTIPTLLSGTVIFIPQNEAGASYTRKIHRNDAALDFNTPTRALYDRIRALSPWPGAHALYKDGLLKFSDVQIAAYEGNADPGTIVAVDNDGITAATADGALRFGSIQRPGGKMLPAKDFLLGFDIITGDHLASERMNALVHAPDPFPKNTDE